MPNNQLSKPQKILFVINPISGDIDKNYLQEKIEVLAAKKQFAFEIQFTKGKNDQRLITEAIRKFAPGKVVAVGGDGTCNLVAKILMNRNILMGIIPLGSANGLAKELQIPQNLDEAMKTIIADKSKAIDLVIINQKHVSLHLADIGINAQVVKRFERDHIRGFAGYAKHFIQELFAARPLKFKVTLDGRKIIKKAYMVVIANATKYGTGAIINPKGSISDGKFEIILIRPYSVWHLFQMVIPFFTRKIHELDYIKSYSGQKATIHNYGKKELQIDGEVIGRLKEINVEINPHALEILVSEY
ncbi:diacylglycerol kinase family protein [uncultured Sunxiuqinia sp.]|uniref:diacylglycerol/lipid kinase family protein n=1 Tax=uncultured Sunxiuqinia sp. TaxID=1573825 RepID=UPI0030DBE20D|tara:strand:+ start:5680 stop:6585 length:906 start_codon:yes stop_codon:yes gene_type:complete